MPTNYICTIQTGCIDTAAYVILNDLCLSSTFHQSSFSPVIRLSSSPHTQIGPRRPPDLRMQLLRQFLFSSSTALHPLLPGFKNQFSVEHLDASLAPRRMENRASGWLFLPKSSSVLTRRSTGWLARCLQKYRLASSMSTERGIREGKSTCVSSQPLPPVATTTPSSRSCRLSCFLYLHSFVYVALSLSFFLTAKQDHKKLNLFFSLLFSPVSRLSFLV